MAARPIAVQLSLLGELPPELILAIASFLPRPGLVCLSLTCTALYSYLQEQCQAFRYAGTLKNLDFLRLLERDLPTHVVCSKCKKLHSMAKARHYQAYRRKTVKITPSEQAASPCAVEDAWNFVGITVHHEFSSVIFQMAMKAHRKGYDTSQLLSLLSCKPGNKTCTGFATQRSAAARIHNHSLLVREQWVNLVPCSQKLPLPYFGRISICIHIEMAELATSLHQYGIRVPYANQIEQHENKEGIMYCEKCYTEFRVDFKSYGAAGNAMFITKWMDLGKGPSGVKLRRRLSLSDSEEKINPMYSRGALCAAFEQKPADEFDFDLLSSQHNEKHISNQSLGDWPENSTVTFAHTKQHYEPRNGRFVSVRQGTSA